LNTEGSSVEAPKAPRAVGAEGASRCGRGYPPSSWGWGLGKELCPLFGAGRLSSTALCMSSGVFGWGGGAFGDAPTLMSHTIYTRILHALCMDVWGWCDAFCCRYVDFKTVFQSAAEHAIFIFL